MPNDLLMFLSDCSLLYRVITAFSIDLSFIFIIAFDLIFFTPVFSILFLLFPCSF